MLTDQSIDIGSDKIAKMMLRVAKLNAAVEMMKLYHTSHYAHRPVYDEALNIVKQELGVPNAPTK